MLPQKKRQIACTITEKKTDSIFYHGKKYSLCYHRKKTDGMCYHEKKKDS